MAIKIGANLAYNGKLPNFERDSFETKAAMIAFDENSVDEGHLSYCKEDGNIYQYKSANTVDATTGRWRLFKTDIVVDAALNGTSTNAIQNKAVFDTLKLKADAAALGAYQPKYKADYVVTKDFNYSDLPNNVNTIDLNGYTLSIDSAITVSGNLLNGSICIKTNDVWFDANKVINCTIYSNNSAFYIGIVDTVFYNCSILNAIFSGEPKFYNCTLNDWTFGNIAPIIYNSIIKNPKITGTIYYPLYNVIIDNVVYKKAIIKDGKFIEAGFESNINTPAISGNAPSCEAVNAKFANYLTKTDANTTYAKKSDISNIYKFKGTKTNYANLPTTDRVTGDVWNITNADVEHGIKAGDNVAWNGTVWDNLSGTVDLSAYATTTTTDAMSADIKKLMDKAFPFTVKVSIDKTLAKKGTSQAVKVTITPKIGDDNTNVDTILINGGEHHGAIPYVYSDTATTTTTYNVRADKDGRTAQGSATITFVNPSYDGTVAANFTVTEANIKALTETLRSGKGGTRTFNLDNQKACIAYPKAFGAVTGIKDANGFDYLDSYTRSELNVNGELYYVYLLTNAATITDMKQTIS